MLGKIFLIVIHKTYLFITNTLEWRHTGRVTREGEKKKPQRGQRYGGYERTNTKKRSLVKCAEGTGMMRLKVLL